MCNALANPGVYLVETIELQLAYNTEHPCTISQSTEAWLWRIDSSLGRVMS